ncbi:MAG: hypothetical protein CM1200mP14_02620 [Gammaproteobacteria bacterium]|nr:MAG: hypothetical protein CM1200mP14_02620 [Gammaproteobacteria bacterium]
MGREVSFLSFSAGLEVEGPGIGIGFFVGLILICVTLFDPTGIAKLASAFQLTVFALACFAVIVMRERGSRHMTLSLLRHYTRLFRSLGSWLRSGSL